MKFPHKWPGRPRLVVLLAALTLRGDIKLTRWVAQYAALSRSKQKLHYDKLICTAEGYIVYSLPDNNTIKPKRKIT